MKINWLQENENKEFTYTISAKGFRNFKNKLQERQVSKILQGPDLQIQFDKWSSTIEEIAKSVSKRKKKKGRSIRRWIKVKKSVKKSLKGNCSLNDKKLLRSRL